jgi:hypothetical protein
MPKTGEQLPIDHHHRATQRNRGTADRVVLPRAGNAYALRFGRRGRTQQPDRSNRILWAWRPVKERSMCTNEGLSRFTIRDLAPDSRKLASPAGTKRQLENR